MIDNNITQGTGRSAMIPGMMRTIRILLIFLIFSLGLTGTLHAASYEHSVEGYVSVIKSTELYLNGQRYFVAPEVKFTLYKDYGRPIDRKEILAMGKIERARIYIKDSKVYRVTVLKIEQ
jgi:hypothetical protein